MNLLIDNLPTKIQVNDRIYDINYDYKTIINILMAFEDKELTEQEKIYVMLKNLYKEEIAEEYIEEACQQAIKFIDLGKYDDNQDVKKEKRIYSFKKDGNYIFTGINSTHNIDLSKYPDLHWWKFMAMFMDMDNECFFSELVYYRKRKLEGKLTKEEKKKYKEIKNLVEIDEDEINKSKEQSQAKKQFLEEFYR